MKRILFIITLLLFSCVELFSQCLNSGAATTLKQTFGNGIAQFSANTPAVEGFTTSYNQVFGVGSNTINDGQFAFINSLPNPFNVWHLGAKDHTGDPGGYMMMVNASFAPDEFYRQNISGLCVGVTYDFSVWLANVDLYNPARIKPNVRFEIRNSLNNNLITFYETGNINSQNTFQWIQHSLTFTTTTSNITLLLLNNNPGGGGNDLALDDIEFKPCLPKYSINIANGIKNLCVGDDLHLTGSVIGTDYLTPEYQWQHENSAGTMIDIIGANSKTFSKNKIALADSGWYRLLISENAILNSIQCRSIDSIFVKIYPELNPGKIGSNQSICYNSKPAVLSSIAPATGGDGSFTYSWEYSEDLITWIDLNTAAISFTETQKLVKTRNYRRKVITTCYEGYSDTVKVIVLPKVLPGKIGSNQSICYNSKPAALSSITLATGGDGNFTYSWEYSEDLTTWIDLNSATSSFTETQKLLSTRNYRRKVISGCYEGYSDTVKIIVLPAVLPGKIASSQTICYNSKPAALSSITLATGGDGNFTYSWEYSEDLTTWIDLNSATSSFTETQKLLSTRNYRRKVISGCYEGYSDTVKIIVLPAVLPGKIASSQTICYNSKPAVLSSIAPATGGDGSFTYSWEYSEDLTTWIDLNTATISFTETQKLLSTRNYRRKVVSGCYQGYSDTVTAMVLPKVQPGSIGSDQNICYNSKPAALSSIAPATGGDGNFIYSWEYSEDLTTWIDLNTATISFTETEKLLSTRNYRRKVISGCNEGYSDTITVKVLPEVQSGSVGSDQIVCDGAVPKAIKEVAASSGGDGNYTYSWELSTDFNNWQLQSNSNTINYLPVNTISTDTWYRRKTQDGICPAVYSDTIKLTYQLTSIPTVTNIKLCKDIQTVPFSIAGTNLLWYQDLLDVTGESTIPSPNTQQVGTFNYFVSQTVNTCESNKAKIQVEILSKPEISVNSLAICEGEEGLLTTSVVGGTGMLDYTWTPITGLSFVSSSSATVQPSIPTNYQIIVTDSEFCKDTVVAAVTINPKPIVTIDGSDVCSGSPVSLNASVTNYTGALHYDWSPTLGLSSVNAATVVATPLVTTDYKLEVIDSKNCKTEATKTVGVTTRPIAKIIGNDTILCTGESVEYQSYKDPLENYSFVWYKSDDNINFYQVSTQSNYTTSERGYFRLYAYNNGICEAQSQIVHVETEDISIKLNAQSSTVDWNDPINLYVIGGLSTYTYTWKPNPPISTVNSSKVSFYNNQSEMYYVLVQGDKCFAEDSIFIKVLPPIKIPNVITPNGDNVNDAWEIAGLSEYTSAEVIIFNRWGTIVYNYPNGYVENWRGISKNGGELPDGTYFYIINLKDNHNKSFNGYVQIIR